MSLGSRDSMPRPPPGPAPAFGPHSIWQTRSTPDWEPEASHGKGRCCCPSLTLCLCEMGRMIQFHAWGWPET